MTWWVRGSDWERFGALILEVGLLAAVCGAGMVLLARRRPPIAAYEASAWRRAEADYRASLRRPCDGT